MRGTRVSISPQVAVDLPPPRSESFLLFEFLRNSTPFVGLGFLPFASKDPMAAGNMAFDQELVPTAMPVDAYERYLASPSHAVTHSQNSGDLSAPSGLPDMGLLVAGIGIPPANFVMPEGALAAAGYDAVEAVPVSVPAARQPRSAKTDGEVVPYRGPWTKEEDETLKEKVEKLGKRNWAAISEHLHGRTGKQCRERWTNHLCPGLGKKKDMWTEEDDRKLIEAHKIHGNRWSVIAKSLEGRSENAVKNHWNATKRSLKSKRRLKRKKSEQAPPGQFTLLEEYIRSQLPAVGTDQPTEPPSSSILGHFGDPEILPDAAAQAAVGASILPGMGMYLTNDSAARSSMNLNMPALPDLNDYGAGETQLQLQYGVLPEEINAGYMQDAYFTNLDMSELDMSEFAPENFLVSESELDQFFDGAWYDNEAGPSSAGCRSDPDDIDVVQMASREFVTPSEEEVTLDLTKL